MCRCVGVEGFDPDDGCGTAHLYRQQLIRGGIVRLDEDNRQSCMCKDREKKTACYTCIIVVAAPRHRDPPF